MNVKQSRLLSFLSKAARGEASVPPHILDSFAEAARHALEKHFTEERRDFTLRMSNIGKPTCQLQMQANGVEGEPRTYDFKMRMILGDLIEALLIALMESSGIEIKSKHGKVSYEVDGKTISGEYDIELDDGIYDIKTASPFAFEHKFNADNAFEKIKDNDSFGYIAQGIGYGMAANRSFKGWIAVNKSTGEIAFADAIESVQEKDEVHEKIRKSIVATDGAQPFERQFHDVPEVFYKKETGNRVLGVECSFCDYKRSCWDNLEFRRQLPSKGKNPKFVWYTHITDEWRERDANNNV